MCWRHPNRLSPHRIQQSPWFDLQCARESYHIQKSDIPLAPLHPSDVIPVKIGEFCELFLREATFKPELADGRTQDASRIGISHEFITNTLTTMSLHTISVIYLTTDPDVAARLAAC